MGKWIIHHRENACFQPVAWGVAPAKASTVCLKPPTLIRILRTFYWKVNWFIKVFMLLRSPTAHPQIVFIAGLADGLDWIGQCE
jgi:hypothetical protein